MSDDAPLSFVVGPGEAGHTVLAALAERLPDVPTAHLRHLVQDGGVTLNGQRCGPGQALGAGDRLELDPGDLERIEPAPLPGFSVLYEDAQVLACMKPAGVAVEAERGDDERPFKAAILHHLARQGGDGPLPRPRIVHRLDKDTTGVVLVAKSKEALTDLTRQLEERRVHKDYLALVLGAVKRDEGEVDLPLPDPAAPRRGAAPRVEARTRWEVVERFHTHTLLRCHPVTGRQHQIRQHLAAAGHPLAVDPQYGGGAALLLSKVKRGYRPKAQGEERPLLARLSLHAERIVFRSPATGEAVEVRAPIPEDLDVALRQLRKWDVAHPTTRRRARG
ncbi:MAG: RluA family pseudouridine synthase [Planctomycetes bacterium]|nr:RluA family pseudouridine synthase [Planctomycetota bacterium]